MALIAGMLPYLLAGAPMLAFSRLVPAFALAFGGLVLCSAAVAQEDKVTAEVRASTEQLVKAFNEGKAADLAVLFSPQGELIDEEGTHYVGRKELTELLTKFFEKFPGAKLAVEIESIRSLGPNLAIEEGTRFIEAATKDSPTPGRATLRYTAVRSKENGAWLIASLREFTADPVPTPNEHLQSLAWVVGDWVNEGTDGAVRISFKWSEDKNFLLGEYQVTLAGQPAMKSHQRIGWDPLTGKVRSWLFDADGGFSEGAWTAVEDGWVIKSESVNPDATTGSATLTVTPTDKDHFTLKGTERIVGDLREPDFEFQIARRPPVASK
jgi:uncharacterized protein (TIGR02246 family)